MASSGYSLLGIPETRQTLVHVHPGAEELGRVYRPNLAIHASPAAFAAAAGAFTAAALAGAAFFAAGAFAAGAAFGVAALAMVITSVSVPCFT